ncbi:MAG: hypothetical protein ABJM06_05300 [Gilvibacter sp.]
MRSLYALLLLASIVVWGSCRNDFETVDSTGNLEFSRDTVYLDTVFTNIGSSTYNLKVYNRSDDDINIPSINLGQNDASLYRLNVDGIPGKTFTDVTVRAKDSIFVFVETTLDIEALVNQGDQFLYTDQIQFDAGGNQQNVELVTLVQDAVFLFPARDADGTIETLNLGNDADGEPILIEGFFLEDDQLTFNNEKPYVIYGYAAVGVGKTMTVDPGARLHFHKDSGILVANTASLQVNGAPSTDPIALENEVIFEGDRLEPGFSEVPGQWGAIWLTQGSTGHVFTNATIKNATVGILMDSNDGGSEPTLTLRNTQIYNSSNVGLLARTGFVDGENVVINNAGQTALSCSLGGHYDFRHCTFVNYWTDGFRSFPAVQIDNVLQVAEDQFVVADLVQANFTNCIISGNENIELGLFDEGSVAFNVNFTNTLIQFNDVQGVFDGVALYDFGNALFYNNIALNEDPDFLDPFTNKLNIGADSGANGLDGSSTPIVPFDILGTARTSPFDAGAYESVIFPDED